MTYEPAYETFCILCKISLTIEKWEKSRIIHKEHSEKPTDPFDFIGNFTFDVVFRNCSEFSGVFLVFGNITLLDSMRNFARCELFKQKKLHIPSSANK